MEESRPTPEEAESLYLRLAGGDPVAPADFAAAFLDPLVAFLRAEFPHADEHLRVTAAEDTVLSVLRNPGVFQQSRSSGGVAAFLRMAARRDLLNLLARERKHHAGRESAEFVELASADGNGVRDDASDLPSFDDPDLTAVIAAFTDGERRVFELMRAGAWRTGEFAAELGITDLPADEQAREVKRFKDRIVKRLRRAREGS